MCCTLYFCTFVLCMTADRLLYTCAARGSRPGRVSWSLLFSRYPPAIPLLLGVLGVWGSVEGGYLCVWFLRRGGELVPRQVGCLVLSCQVLQLLSLDGLPPFGVLAPPLRSLPFWGVLGSCSFLFFRYVCAGGVPRLVIGAGCVCVLQVSSFRLTHRGSSYIGRLLV